MALDRRVHVRVRGVLVMDWHLLVDGWESVRCWRLQRVDELGWVEGIIVLNRWEKLVRDRRELQRTDMLFLRLRFGHRVGGFWRITLDRREGGDGNREIPGFRTLSCTYAAWTDSAGCWRGTLRGRVLGEIFRSDKFGAETSTRDA